MNAVMLTGADQRDKHTKIRNKRRLVFIMIKKEKIGDKKGGKEKL